MGVLVVVRRAHIDALLDLRILRSRRRTDLDELQLAGALQRLDRLLGVVDAGHLDDDPVLALQLHQRLGHAERVHAALDDHFGRFHVGRGDDLAGRWLGLQKHLGAAAQVKALLEVSGLRKSGGCQTARPLHPGWMLDGQGHVKRNQAQQDDETQHQCIATSHVFLSPSGIAMIGIYPIRRSRVLETNAE